MNRCTNVCRVFPASKTSGYYQAFYENDRCIAVRLYNYLGEFVRELEEGEIYKFLRRQANGGEDSNTVEVCVYCDSTDLYTEEECDRDNLTYLGFPEKIVKEWFDKQGFFCYTNFDKWLYEEYTADDTDGLYWYAIDCGFKAERED